MLSVIDMHSKFAWHFALFTETAAEVEVHLQDLFHQEGIPKFGLTDNGGHFTSEEAHRLLNSLGIRMQHGKPWTPTTQGSDERLHQTVAAQCRVHAREHAGGWSHMLGTITYLYNTRVHSTIRMTPYEAHRGQKAVTAGWEHSRLDFDESALLVSTSERMLALERTVHGNIADRAIQTVARHSKKHRLSGWRALKVGNVVYLQDTANRARQWRAVGVVVASHEDTYTYDMKLLTRGFEPNQEVGLVLRNWPHRKTMFAAETEIRARDRMLIPSEEADDQDEQAENKFARAEDVTYQVELIIGKTVGDFDEFEYLVKWQNYPWVVSSWIPRHVF